ncbi:response regulator [Candidatus Bathyarchaeota archaeon]|nr:response regulator [Candidatus Bathyarchaeota archaeon]MBT7187721.1 response regulator [Candidatus Bathyarchaeota archaeon]
MIRILLVDDDRYLQEVYMTLFPLGGIDVISQAYDGIQAVENYNRLDEKPDVVLMDQRMPRLDGLGATKKLMEIDPDVKVIFLSADDTSKQTALDVGASIFLSKPVQIEFLFNTIKELASK